MSDTQKATVTVEGESDGLKVTISYEDGHVVYLSVRPDSFVLRRHLGLPEVDDAPV
jgi:hypothetical protein